MTHILIVDDKEENLYFLQALLTGNGYTVESAHQGADALAKALQSPPDLVISDLLMPVMDGYALLRHWKADLRLQHVPFIVYTSTYTDPEDERLARSLGADAFILKPSEPEDFLARVREVQAGAAAAVPIRARHPVADGGDQLKVYNTTLVRKLEEKSLQLEQSNRLLHEDIAVRSIVEAALRESEEKFRILAEAMPQVVWITRPDGWNIYFNQQWMDYTGLTLEESLGHGWNTPFHPEDRARAWGDWQNATTTGGTYSLEARLRRADGVYRWWLVRGVPFKDAAGNVLKWFGTCTDIHEVKEAEGRFRATFENAAVGIAHTGFDDRLLLVNNKFCEMLGYTAAELLALTTRDIAHPEDLQTNDLDEKRMLAGELGKIGYVVERRCVQKGGAVLWTRHTVSVARDDDGKPLYFIRVIADISDRKNEEEARKRNEIALAQAERFSRATIDALTKSLCVLDETGTIIRVNKAWRAFASINGSSPAAVHEGANYLAVCDAAAGHGDPDATAVAAGIRSVLAGERPEFSLEYPCHSPQSQAWFVVRVTRFEGEGEKRIVVTHEDVTVRKQAEMALLQLNDELERKVEARTEDLSQARAQAEQASQAKSEFLASMSHEIRTPMSGLLGLLELLELSRLDEAQQSTLGLARESGATLLSIIDDILDFSKIEAKRLDLHLEACSVRDVVDKAYRLHAPVASSKNLSLQVAVAPQVSRLLAADPLRLGQILNNFLSNAIKFTDQGSVQVRVELLERAAEAERLRFVVQDTGIGMSAQQLGRLFQPFVQADAAISTRFGGTGLGLVIARRLAELMGGTVHIASEPGRGTTLTLEVSLEICGATGQALPAPPTRRDALAALVQGRRSAPSPQEAEAEGTLVLLVDDHPTNRQVLLRQLASLGYAAVAAEDGVQALALWRSRRFGAVITDCNMPRMNGYELATQIRALERSNSATRVPIIACTANAMPAAVQACVAAGMDDQVVKPASLADIGRKLAQWLPLGGVGAEAAASAPTAARAQQAPADQSAGLLDLVLLAEIAGGAAGLQVGMLADFRRVNDRDAADLRAAAEAGDFARARESSHRIKGASLMLGATSLADASASVETAAAAQDRDRLGAAVTAFEQELLRLNDHLDRVSCSLAASPG